MSQRDSGYERKERDCYETPGWVTHALIPHIMGRIEGPIWEPAAGSGKMSTVLSLIAKVYATDITSGTDFLKISPAAVRLTDATAIITNPPYVNAEAFIIFALTLMKPVNGFVAMLLRTDYDHAKTRRNLFSKHPAFAKKIVLTKRIRWFEDSKGSPSFNHAWFIWDWKNQTPPVIAYD